MGNLTGAGVGAAVGSIFGPVGAVVGATVGGITGTIAEPINAAGGTVPSGYGTRSVGKYVRENRSMKITALYVAKCDLCVTGLNTVASVGRILFAPATTLMNGNKSFWFEHRWIILQTISSSGETWYITAWKGPEGIRVCGFYDWDDCWRSSNVGMGGETVRNSGIHQRDTVDRGRSVGDFIDKVTSMSTYYHLSSDNCQDFAKEIYRWH